MDGSELAALTWDMRPALRRWQNEDVKGFKVEVENAVWSGQYEYPLQGALERLCDPLGSVEELHGVELDGHPEEDRLEGVVRVKILVAITDHVMYSSNYDVDEQRRGYLMLSIDTTTGKGTVTETHNITEAET